MEKKAEKIKNRTTNRTNINTNTVRAKVTSFKKGLLNAES